MSINALIAQGGRPIGADLPDIANMLQQRSQQTLQNNRLATQDQYAAEEHAQRVDGYNEEKKTRDAHTAFYDTKEMLALPDNQLPQVIASHPQAAAALQQAGIDLSDPSHIPAARAYLQKVNQITGERIGIAQPQQLETIGDLNDPNQGVYQRGAEDGKLTSIRAPRDPLEADKFTEAKRHNRVEEGISAQKAATDQVANIEVGNPALSGDQYLATIPENMRGTVKAWSEGRMQLPNNRVATKDPKTAAMLNALAHYDPNFDFANAGARAAVRKSFTAGTDADNVKNIGTAIHHLATMKGDYDKLDNTRFAWANSVKNAVVPAFGGQKTQAAVGAVGADALAVSHELASVFRRTGMSETEIHDWQKQISTSATPASSNSIIDKALELMDGRLYELGQKYNTGMGTTKDPMELLKPEDQKLYRKLKGSDAPAVSVPGRGVGASGASGGWTVKKVT